MGSKTFNVGHKDDVLNIMDMVNEALEEYGLAFETDDGAHDGFQPYTLVETTKQKDV